MKKYRSYYCMVLLSALILPACDQQTEPVSSTPPPPPAPLVTIKASAQTRNKTERHSEEGHKHHKSETHHHGAAPLNLVFDNKQLDISLSISGMDAVGFEHPAASAEEQAILQKALGHLQDPDGMFAFSHEAKCALVAGTVETALLNTTAKKSDHADIAINYQWRCDSPQDLKKISVQLFSYFPHLEKIQAKWVTSAKQGAAELTKIEPTFLLE